jgi:hypothetical protein
MTAYDSQQCDDLKMRFKCFSLFKIGHHEKFENKNRIFLGKTNRVTINIPGLLPASTAAMTFVPEAGIIGKMIYRRR